MKDCINVNFKFLEEYKKLDKLCKDCYSSVEGVSEYIRQMENEQCGLRRLPISWEDDYKTLKHVRWVRNQLSHEVGALQSDICTLSDLYFVTMFYEKIMKCEDPLAQMRALKENERKTQSRKNTISTSKPTEQNAHLNKNNKKSIFSKLLEKIKKIFS